jgi:hypothetical protein
LISSLTILDYLVEKSYISDLSHRHEVLPEALADGFYDFYDPPSKGALRLGGSWRTWRETNALVHAKTAKGR